VIFQPYLIFKVATPIRAKMMERIQKRIVIMFSAAPTERPAAAARSLAINSK
jgi:hypothetical protein